MSPSRSCAVSSAALAVTARENVMTTASSRDKTFFFILLPPLKAREMTSRGMDIV